jgi:acyl carrier protein
MNGSTETKLQAIFRSVFQLPEEQDASGVSRSNQPTWDSIAHVMLVTALESEFDINLDTADALAIESYDSAAKVLRGHGF